MKSPLISVVMPVYNNERYFPIAVESVLSQGFRDFELIIINDGSTDNTPQIADDFANIDSRITVIHQENQWIYASINNGVKKAKGEYVYFLNSDDTFIPNALQTMVDIVDVYNPDVIWTKVLIHKCDENQNIKETLVIDYGNIDDYYYKSIDEVRNNYILFSKFMYSQNQANLYRTSIAKKHQHKNKFYGEDKIFNINIANNLNSAYVCRTPIYNHFYYEKEGMNISVNKWYGYEHEMFNEFYHQYVELYKSWGIWDNNIESILIKFRFNEFKNELALILSDSCTLTIKQKIKEVFSVIVDDTVYNAALYLSCIEEMDCRIFSVCKDLFNKEQLDNKFEFHFVYEMLDILLTYTLRYEKKVEDLDKFKERVYHIKNPYHIGKGLYENLVKGLTKNNV